MRKITSPAGLLGILVVINFINYVDRSIIGAVVPLIRLPVTGLNLDDAQIGILGSAFMVVHSVASIPLGYLADRFIRKRIIALGVFVWSLATALAGLARNFGQMFLARAAVGVGEAAYAPAATALISDRFPPAQRARALGVFQLGTSLGAAVGLVGGGYVAATLGWRAAFLIVGLPGLILAAVVLLVDEAPRVVAPPAPGRGGLVMLVRFRAGDVGSWAASAWITAAGILTTFFTGALMVWGVEFIVRVHYGGQTKHMTAVTGTFGPIVFGAALLGVFTGAAVADRLEKRWPGAGRLYTIAAGVLISVPFAAVAFHTRDMRVLYSALGAGMFFNVWYLGPILAALHDVVPLRLRATATGAYFFLIHALGDAISPLVVGAVAKVTGSLVHGLMLATGFMAVGGLSALMAVPRSRDVAKLKREPVEHKIAE